MKWSTRRDWGARAPHAVRTDVQPVGVAQHWYGGGSFARADHDGCLALVKAAQDMHMAVANVNDIYYNLAACHHGYVIEARSTKARPRVRGGANGDAASNTAWYSVLALWGAGDGKPSDQLLGACRDAIDYLRSHAGAGTRMSGHRDHTATSCPGEDLYRWAHAGAPRPAQKVEELDQVDDDTVDRIARRVLTMDGVIRNRSAHAANPDSGAAYWSLATHISDLEDTQEKIQASQADLMTALTGLTAQVAELAASLRQQP